MSRKLNNISSRQYLRYLSSSEEGFSLLEVLVALLVISISLLGVAGMQAISLNNTGESGFRSIAATQASSIAGAMGTNEDYWQTTTTPLSFTVSGAAVSINSAAVTPIPVCTAWGGGTPCTPQQLAEYDLSQWGIQLQQSLPGGTGNITCNFSGMLICQVQVAWLEKNMAQNQSSTASANSGSNYHLELMVEP